MTSAATLVSVTAAWRLGEPALMCQGAVMVEVLIAEPGDLTSTQLEDAEALVRAAFGSGFRSHDWAHAVEGVHVFLTEDQALVAFAAVVPRTLRHDDRVFDTGYVEAVAVCADQQGRGLGGAVMAHAETIIKSRHRLGALNAVESAAGFYGHRGWQPWTGHTQASDPTGALVDTSDDADRIFLLTPPQLTEPLEAHIPLICDWRDGDLW